MHDDKSDVYIIFRYRTQKNTKNSHRKYMTENIYLKYYKYEYLSKRLYILNQAT